MTETETRQPDPAQCGPARAPSATMPTMDASVPAVDGLVGRTAAAAPAAAPAAGVCTATCSSSASSSACHQPDPEVLPVPDLSSCTTEPEPTVLAMWSASRNRAAQTRALDFFAKLLCATTSIEYSADTDHLGLLNHIATHAQTQPYLNPVVAQEVAVRSSFANPAVEAEFAGYQGSSSSRWMGLSSSAASSSSRSGTASVGGGLGHAARAHAGSGSGSGNTPMALYAESVIRESNEFERTSSVVDLANMDDDDASSDTMSNASGPISSMMDSMHAEERLPLAQLNRSAMGQDASPAVTSAAAAAAAAAVEHYFHLDLGDSRSFNPTHIVLHFRLALARSADPAKQMLAFAKTRATLSVFGSNDGVAWEPLYGSGKSQGGASHHRPTNQSSARAGEATAKADSAASEGVGSSSTALFSRRLASRLSGVARRDSDTRVDRNTNSSSGTISPASSQALSHDDGNSTLRIHTFEYYRHFRVVGNAGLQSASIELFGELMTVSALARKVQAFQQHQQLPASSSSPNSTGVRLPGPLHSLPSFDATATQENVREALDHDVVHHVVQLASSHHASVRHVAARLLLAMGAHESLCTAIAEHSDLPRLLDLATASASAADDIVRAAAIRLVLLVFGTSAAAADRLIQLGAAPFLAYAEVVGSCSILKYALARLDTAVVQSHLASQSRVALLMSSIQGSIQFFRLDAIVLIPKLVQLDPSFALELMSHNLIPFLASLLSPLAMQFRDNANETSVAEATLIAILDAFVALAAAQPQACIPPIQEHAVALGIISAALNDWSVVERCVDILMLLSADSDIEALFSRFDAVNFCDNSAGVSPALRASQVAMAFTGLIHCALCHPDHEYAERVWKFILPSSALGLRTSSSASSDSSSTSSSSFSPARLDTGPFLRACLYMMCESLGPCSPHIVANGVFALADRLVSDPHALAELIVQLEGRSRILPALLAKGLACVVTIESLAPCIASCLDILDVTLASWVPFAQASVDADAAVSSAFRFLLAVFWATCQSAPKLAFRASCMVCTIVRALTDAQLEVLVTQPWLDHASFGSRDAVVAPAAAPAAPAAAAAQQEKTSFSAKLDNLAWAIIDSAVVALHMDSTEGQEDARPVDFNQSIITSSVRLWQALCARECKDPTLRAQLYETAMQTFKQQSAAGHMLRLIERLDWLSKTKPLSIMDHSLFQPPDLTFDLPPPPFSLITPLIVSRAMGLTMQVMIHASRNKHLAPAKSAPLSENDDAHPTAVDKASCAVSCLLAVIDNRQLEMFVERAYDADPFTGRLARKLLSVASHLVTPKQLASLPAFGYAWGALHYTSFFEGTQAATQNLAGFIPSEIAPVSSAVVVSGLPEAAGPICLPRPKKTPSSEAPDSDGQALQAPPQPQPQQPDPTKPAVLTDVRRLVAILSPSSPFSHIRFRLTAANALANLLTDCVQLSFERNDDGQGLFTWIGTKAGQLPYANPVITGEVLVEASPALLNSGSEADFIAREPGPFSTADRSDSLVYVDVSGGSRQRAICPTHYALCDTASWEHGSYVTNWELQGRVDKSHPWLVLRRHMDDHTLCRRNATQSWFIQGSAAKSHLTGVVDQYGAPQAVPHQHTPQPPSQQQPGLSGAQTIPFCSEFRVVCTGPGTGGRRTLTLAGFELYGLVREGRGASPETLEALASQFVEAGGVEHVSRLLSQSQSSLCDAEARAGQLAPESREEIAAHLAASFWSIDSGTNDTERLRLACIRMLQAVCTTVERAARVARAVQPLLNCLCASESLSVQNQTSLLLATLCESFMDSVVLNPETRPFDAKALVSALLTLAASVGRVVASRAISIIELLTRHLPEFGSALAEAGTIDLLISVIKEERTRGTLLAGHPACIALCNMCVNEELRVRVLYHGNAHILTGIMLNARTELQRLVLAIMSIAVPHDASALTQDDSMLRCGTMRASFFETLLANGALAVICEYYEAHSKSPEWSRRVSAYFGDLQLPDDSNNLIVARLIAQLTQHLTDHRQLLQTSVLNVVVALLATAEVDVRCFATAALFHLTRNSDFQVIVAAHAPLRDILSQSVDAALARLPAPESSPSIDTQRSARLASDAIAQPTGTFDSTKVEDRLMLWTLRCFIRLALNLILLEGFTASRLRQLLTVATAGDETLIQETTQCLKLIVKSSDNRSLLVEHGFIPLLLSMVHSVDLRAFAVETLDSFLLHGQDNDASCIELLLHDGIPVLTRLLEAYATLDLSRDASATFVQRECTVKRPDDMQSTTVAALVLAHPPCLPALISLVMSPSVLLQRVSIRTIMYLAMSSEVVTALARTVDSAWQIQRRLLAATEVSPSESTRTVEPVAQMQSKLGTRGPTKSTRKATTGPGAGSQTKGTLGISMLPSFVQVLFHLCASADDEVKYAAVRVLGTMLPIIDFGASEQVRIHRFHAFVSHTLSLIEANHESSTRLNLLRWIPVLFQILADPAFLSSTEAFFTVVMRVASKHILEMCLSSPLVAVQAIAMDILLVVGVKVKQLAAIYLKRKQAASFDTVGLGEVVQLLLSPHDSLRTKAARVLATLSASADHANRIATEGALDHLLVLLRLATNTAPAEYHEHQRYLAECAEHPDAGAAPQALHHARLEALNLNALPAAPSPLQAGTRASDRPLETASAPQLGQVGVGSRSVVSSGAAAESLWLRLPLGFAIDEEIIPIVLKTLRRLTSHSHLAERYSRRLRGDDLLPIVVLSNGANQQLSAQAKRILSNLNVNDAEQLLGLAASTDPAAQLKALTGLAELSLHQSNRVLLVNRGLQPLLTLVEKSPSRSLIGAALAVLNNLASVAKCQEEFRAPAFVRLLIGLVVEDKHTWRRQQKRKSKLANAAESSDGRAAFSAAASDDSDADSDGEVEASTSVLETDDSDCDDLSGSMAAEEVNIRRWACSIFGQLCSQNDIFCIELVDLGGLDALNVALYSNNQAIQLEAARTLRCISTCMETHFNIAAHPVVQTMLIISYFSRGVPSDVHRRLGAALRNLGTGWVPTVVKRWTPADVLLWVQCIGLAQFLPVFAAMRVTDGELYIPPHAVASVAADAAGRANTAHRRSANAAIAAGGGGNPTFTHAHAHSHSHSHAHGNHARAHSHGHSRHSSTRQSSILSGRSASPSNDPQASRRSIVSDTGSLEGVASVLGRPSISASNTSDQHSSRHHGHHRRHHHHSHRRHHTDHHGQSQQGQASTALLNGRGLLAVTDNDAASIVNGSLRDTSLLVEALHQLRAESLLDVVARAEVQLRQRAAESTVAETVQPPKQQWDIFLSYRHLDGDFARALEADLNERGFSVWVDKNDISAGNDWRSDIANGIDNALCVVFLMTPGSVQSKYCLEEVHYAYEADKPIFPVVFVDAYEHMKGALKMMLSRIQWIDFENIPYETSLLNLIGQVDRIRLEVGRNAVDEEAGENGAQIALPTSQVPEDAVSTPSQLPEDAGLIMSQVELVSSVTSSALLPDGQAVASTQVEAAAVHASSTSVLNASETVTSSRTLSSGSLTQLPEESEAPIPRAHPPLTSQPSSASLGRRSVKLQSTAPVSQTSDDINALKVMLQRQQQQMSKMEEVLQMQASLLLQLTRSKQTM
ncbi:hypothetical protein CAOG_03102 [Capsaspora owczarzaki ATCC 30864]|uniref:TIR domain-containing protein n=1 Tax=Capsaspora owczarzaki (strain ATCC 30864) TaxID=595528 RepID=A0A0D2WMK3_CAPO3|nr:hypothetical protein CAOG_03102 [Capsaspora owczarzaki ATCC 30864]KJE92075.1 hypothetical protein CAOG_003102 [Capsaspora owczarzaki ATCC 30864]|eukprot:XP_004363941.1 hypothetical protein CAOG_03102 [Capsaspora owczarzaki ATCC 30864]